LKYKNNILEQIGNTPLIKLNRINKGLKPQIFAKLESANGLSLFLSDVSVKFISSFSY